MIIGVPKEIKAQENRVGAVPAMVLELTSAGHTVLVQEGAGLGAGVIDEAYKKVGAKMVASAGEVYGKADMIVKVKEPLPAEYPLIKKGQLLFTYFHFAAARELTDAMLKSGASCFAYETLIHRGSLPLLTPMSEVAGRMSVQVGAVCLEKHFGGRGILLGGVPGVEPATVVILGGGVVGTNAAKMAAGLGADVRLLDIDLDRLRYLSDVMPANVTLLHSSPITIREQIVHADLVIGAVLVQGARAPRLIRREDLKSMKEGSVVVDVAVDQGGCIETCKPTTHADPTYVVDGVMHYCVANMPGAVPRTSTFGLTNATGPWAKKLAGMGAAAAAHDPVLGTAANVLAGACTHQGVAEAFNLPYPGPEHGAVIGGPDPGIGLFDALLLGLVEGLTEFLPVSSTGHLILVQRWLELPANEVNNTFAVGIQMGAITAILVLYWRRLWSALRTATSPRRHGPNLLWQVAIAASPAVALGLVADDWIDAHLFSAWVVVATMVAGGLLLLVLERWLRGRSAGTELAAMGYRAAFVIGLCQCLALVPGTSRSAATIAGALLLGLSRTAAAEFSFLVGLPILYGASIYRLCKHAPALTGDVLLPLGVATLVAFASALAVVGPFVRFLRGHTFAPFAWYRIVVGLLLAAALATGWLG